MITIVAMAEIANHAGKEPWPSLDWASWIFDRASWVLVVSLAVGLAATVAMVWMGIVKEHHWDVARDEASHRIAELELETAKANERAEADRLARVKLEEKISPRRMTGADQKLISERISEFKGIVGGIGSAHQDIESLRLETAIHGALKGWDIKRDLSPFIPMWPGGVLVSSRLDLESRRASVKLALALNEAGIFATASAALLPGSPIPSEYQVFITIGSKPDSDDSNLKLNLEVLDRLAAELGVK